jgi:shikimate dehydrogenase
MRKFGLIGKSLDHSWSKEYFQLKFINEKIDHCVYENFPIGDLNGLCNLVLQDSSLSGLNITNPYKLEVLKHLDNLDPLAEAIQAVNCLQITRSGLSVQLKGYNTDMVAFRESLKPLLHESNRKALVLGTGGASRAVCHALKELNIGYSIVSRKEKEGALTYEDLNNGVICDHQMIINATPVGMFPNEGLCPPLPYSFLTSYHLLYDLVYNPEMTLFLKKAQETGARIKNGLEMLQLQAELSWKIWNFQFD